MSRYRLAHENDHSFTIMEESGHSFKIAKAGLKQDVHNRIKKLERVQKMAEGGVVEEDPEVETPEEESPTAEAAVQAPQETPAQPSVQIDPSVLTKPLPDALLNMGGAKQTSPPNVIGSDVQMPKASAPMTGGLMGEFIGNQNQQIQGVQGVADAKGKESKAVANAYDQALIKQKQYDDQYNLEIQANQKRSETLYKDIYEGAIKPTGIFGDMSTGNKILASISLALSGVGSGLTGKENLALKTLNEFVERDIDAQKANLNKKVGLLSSNMQRYRDLQTAEAATRMQMNTALQAQVAKAAAQSGSQIAQSNAQMMIGQLRQQRIPLEQDLAKMSVKAQSLGATGEAGYSVGQEPMILLGDKEYQGKRVVVGGRAYQAPTPEDAKDLKNFQSEYEPVRSMITQLGEINPIEANVPGSEANLRAHALRANLIPRINKMHGLTRLSQEDIKVMGDQISDPTAFKEMINSGIKNTQFFKNLEEDLDANYKTRLINYKGPSKYKTFTPGK